MDINGKKLPLNPDGTDVLVYGWERSIAYAKYNPGGMDANGNPTGALLTPEPLSLWAEAANWGQYDWSFGCPTIV